MKRTAVITLAGGLLCLPALWGAAGCAKKEEGLAATTPTQAQIREAQPITASEMSSAIASLPEPDRGFVREAAGANRAAIQFGQLAMERGSTAGVRSLGRELVDTHTALSDSLRQAAANQNVSLPIATMTHSQQVMFDRLSKLSGDDFDQAFLQDLKTLQQRTIETFQNEAVHGKISSLSILANQSLPALNTRVRTVQNQIRKM